MDFNSAIEQGKSKIKKSKTFKKMRDADHSEGRLARTLEAQTAKLPSDSWLWAALGSLGLSVILQLSGRQKTSNFVGHWVPTFLLFGVYNKISP